MKIDVQIDVSSLQKKLAQASQSLAKVDTALYAAAVKGMQFIKDRTRKGYGLNGFFQRYSPKYALFRMKKGRGLRVDLNFTGQMLASMQARKGNGYADIYFSSARENKKAYFNHKRRPFFGLTRAEKAKLHQLVLKRALA